MLGAARGCPGKPTTRRCSMSVIALMQCNEIVQRGFGTTVVLGPVYVPDANDPHHEEIKSYWDSTPSGKFEMQIKNEKAAEQFQVNEQYYISITKKVREPVAPAS
jgi:hypothetical protein